MPEPESHKGYIRGPMDQPPLPKGTGLRANIALFGPIVPIVAAAAVIILNSNEHNGSGNNSSVAEERTIPTSTFTKEIIDMALFENASPELTWRETP